MSTMDLAALEMHYRSLADDELMQLASESDQLSPEANVALNNELSTRRIGHEQLDSRTNELTLERKAARTEKVSALFPSLRRMQETLSDWRGYHDQTGKWPYLTISFSFLHLLVDLTALGFLVWYGEEHHWSRGRLVLVIMPLLLVDILIFDWVGRKIRLFELARYKE